MEEIGITTNSGQVMDWIKIFPTLIIIILPSVGCGKMVHSMNKDVLATLSDFQVLGQACDLYGMWDERSARLPYIYEAQQRGLACSPAFFQKAEEEEHQMELLMLKENCLPGWIDKRTGYQNWKCQDWYDPSDKNPSHYNGFRWQKGAIMPPY